MTKLTMQHLPTTMHDRIGAAPFTVQIKMHGSACPANLFKIWRNPNLSTCEKAY